MNRLSLAFLGLVSLAGAARAEPCRDITFDDTPLTVCEVAAGDDLRLFLSDGAGEVLGTFARLEAMLAERGERLAFAMNAGMFHPDRQPVGLYVEGGETRAPIVTREGPGNFAMLPNGVFCILPDRFAVIESRAFAADPPACRDATQSGPMLVIDGALHPRFLAESESSFVRNGVGVSDDGLRAYFVISNRPVTFHLFARAFRDGLGVNQALFLDGNTSRLYAPGLGRADWGLPMGPILGLVAPES